MRFKTGKEFRDWPNKAVTIFGMSGRRQDHACPTAAGPRLVPLFGRLPHRHALHGRAHRRQFQARGDEGPLPARSPALGLDLHLLQHHLRESRARCRPISASPATRPRAASPSPNTSAARTQHREAEISALLDVPDFIEQGRATSIGYQHFICDSGGSLCEVVDPDDSRRSGAATASPTHAAALYRGHARRMPRCWSSASASSPSPCTTSRAFLDAKWAEYKTLNGIARRRRRRSRRFRRLGLRAAAASSHSALSGDRRAISATRSRWKISRRSTDEKRTFSSLVSACDRSSAERSS